MKFDEILGKLGEFGTFQKRIYFLLGLPSISIGSFCVMVIVVLYTPKHRCKIPGLDNDTYALQDPIHADLINQTIPLSSDPTLTYDQCHFYKYGYDAESQNATVSMVQCTDWVYDQTVFYDTFTSKANLVCGEAMKTAHIQMLFYFGVLLGDFVLGTIADLTGRKKALILGFVIVLIASVSVTFVRGFIGFSILQLIVGGAAHGAFIVIAVITLEIVGLSHRVWTGMWLQIFFAIGVCYVAVMAFLIRSWMWINLSCAMPCVLYLAYWWCIPESPRWLISKGRQAESATIIQRAAKQNKVTLSLETFAEVKEETKGKDGRIWHVFMSPVLCRRTLILFLNWTVISMTYFGVQMNAENLGGDYYLNFLLMGIAEFPGYAVGILLTDRLGRRPSHVGAMCLGGIACISSLFVVISGRNDLQPLTIALAFIGKAGASAAFGIVYIFTAELLPTVVRNAGMGVCSCAARVGAMLAPYIAKSGELMGGNFGKVFPLVVFGALSIVAGLLVLFLPETLKQKLPDTIEEGENFGRDKKQIDEKEVEVPFISESKLA